MRVLICLLIGHDKFIFTKYLARPSWDVTRITPGIPILGTMCARCGKVLR